MFSLPLPSRFGLCEGDFEGKLKIAGMGPKKDERYFLVKQLFVISPQNIVLRLVFPTEIFQIKLNPGRARLSSSGGGP